MKKTLFGMILVIVLVAAAVCAAQSPSTGPMVKISLLNQDPNPASAGDTVDLRFKVENTGSEQIGNLQVQLIQDYPFSVVNGPDIETVSNLDTYQNGNNYVALKFTVKIRNDVLEGAHQLQIRYSYVPGVWVGANFSVSVVSGEFAQIIYVDKAQLDPGKETSLKFTVTNTGNAPLQNLVFSWDEPTGAVLPVYSSDTKYVKYLEPGKSVDLTYTVIADVNAKPGLYQLNLNLNSQSSTGASSSVITTKAGVFIGGETDFDVSFSESTAGQTSLSIANTGNNPAQSISVTIPNQDSFRVAGTNEAIVGNLDKGDYTIVSFQITAVGAGNFSRQGGRGTGAQQAAQGSAQQTQGQEAQQAAAGATRSGGFPGSNNLLVDIDYTDTTGSRRTIEKSVPIQFRASTTSTGTSGFSRTQGGQTSGFIGSTTFWIILLVVASVVFTIFGSRVKKTVLRVLGRK